MPEKRNIQTTITIKAAPTYHIYHKPFKDNKWGLQHSQTRTANYQNEGRRLETEGGGGRLGSITMFHDSGRYLATCSLMVLHLKMSYLCGEELYNEVEAWSTDPLLLLPFNPWNVESSKESFYNGTLANHFTRKIACFRQEIWIKGN